jgi:hypothetical protein
MMTNQIPPGFDANQSGDTINRPLADAKEDTVIHAGRPQLSRASGEANGMPFDIGQFVVPASSAR